MRRYEVRFKHDGNQQKNVIVEAENFDLTDGMIEFFIEKLTIITVNRERVALFFVRDIEQITSTKIENNNV